MKEKRSKIDRRNFLKTVGAAGLGSALTGVRGVFASAENESNVADSNAVKEKKPALPQVPKRKLGKTGAEISCLGLGTMFNLVDNQVILRNAVKWGVTHWDTSHAYAGGNSELGIGKFISNNSKIRKDLFIVSKASGARNITDVEDRLQTSLERMKTDYIDLYYAHGVSDPGHFTPELKKWVEGAKKRKLIRHFGFSTHSNMAKCLAAAAKLGWIDVITTSYNFRLMQDAELQAAVEACNKAGIGLIAMKTQGHGQRAPWGRDKVKIETEEDKKMAKHFLERDFTEQQTMIKIVLEDKRISSACVGMENVKLLSANIAAVLDKTELTQADREILKEYAKATCSGYCAGCEEICSSACPDMPYTADVMRYVMYYNSYGDREMARELFAQIPGNVRGKLLNVDYSLAEARCPQHLPIGELIAEAVSKLA